MQKFEDLKMWRRLILNLVFLLIFIGGFAQPDSTYFKISTLPPGHPAGEAIYMAGSFNGWNPRDESYRFKTDEQGNYFLRTLLRGGSYEYKITRGSWDKVQCNKYGESIENRRIRVIGGGLVVEVNIEGWTDKFSTPTGKSSASKNVQILTDKFQLPQLNTTRRVWVYLPTGYTSNKQHYPVLYMHDGQNVFEDSTSFSGEWGVDEFMDTVRNKCIVVAIDHGGSKRVNEYSPYDMERYGKGEGDRYVDFLAKTLKPYIDKNYRTLKKKESTFVAGSSMGGLISMYAILKYPKVFGGAGVFSPSFWIAPGIYDAIEAKGEKVKGRIYFYAGKEESKEMVPDMLRAFERMHAVSKANMTTVIRDDGKHNETTWRREFPLFYYWLFKKNKNKK